MFAVAKPGGSATHFHCCVVLFFLPHPLFRVPEDGVLFVLRKQTSKGIAAPQPLKVSVSAITKQSFGRLGQSG